MRNIVSFILCGFLVLCAATSLASAADPTCQNGIIKRGVCCPSKCGQCGGRGCYMAGIRLGTQCCVPGVLESNRSCTVEDAPCVLGPVGALASENDNETLPSSSMDGEWREAPVLDGAVVERHEACAVMVGGEVVLIGGRGPNKPVSIYNPVTKQWRVGSGPGRGIMIHHFQCVEADDKVWAVASWTGKYPNETENDKIWIYDVGLDQWSTRAAMNESRNRGGAASVRRGDWIYVVAGNQGGHGEHAESKTWMDAYNWRNDTWTEPGRFPDMPGGGRDHVGAALVNDELCIAGGRDGGTEGFFNNVLLSTYCFNFTTETWSQREDIPQGRAGAMTGTTCDGKMMIAGGEAFSQAFARVDTFDGRNWTRAPDMKEGRHGSGLAVAQCDRCAHIFIPSGSGRQGGRPELNTTEEYIPRNSPIDCLQY